MDPYPTFGQTLRAYRFRFCWSSKYKCFVRLRNGDSTVTVQLHPAGFIPNAFGGKKAKYFIWWDQPKGEGILELIPALKAIGPIKRPIQFDIDSDTGERI
jgi:hypothetical protein